MVSKKSFKLLVVSSTTPFFTFVQIIYFLDCKNKKIAEILIKEVSNASKKYQHMDIILKKNILEKKVCFYLKKTNFSCRVGGAYS